MKPETIAHNKMRAIEIEEAHNDMVESRAEEIWNSDDQYGQAFRALAQVGVSESLLDEIVRQLAELLILQDADARIDRYIHSFYQKGV